MFRNFSNILLILACLAGMAHAATKSDWIVAIVNEEVILNSQLQEEVNFIRNRIRSTGQQAPPDDALQKLVINSLVERKLQLQRARLIAGDVSPVEVERALRELLASNDVPLGRFLLDQGVNEKQLRDRIAEEILINNGLRLDHQREIVELQFNQSAINEALRANLLDRDMREYLVEHVRLDSADGDLARELQSLQGDDFSRRAAQASNGNALAKLGWQRPEQLRADFYEAIKELAPGSNSQVLELDDGLHVLHLVARRPLVPGQTREGRVKLKLLRVREGGERLEQARSQIVLGEDSFEDVAGELGGQVEVGEFDLEELPASVVQGLRLRVGELGGPFATNDGYVLALVLNIKTIMVGDSRVRDQMTTFVTDNKLEQMRRKWIENLRAIGNIEILRESS